MQFQSLKFSLSREYFIFVSLILLVVVLLSAGFYADSYFKYKKNEEAEISRISLQINRELTSVLSENENILAFFASKIRDHSKEPDLDFIDSLLRETAKMDIRSKTHSYISWANKQGKIIISGKYGPINKNPQDITGREYYITAKNDPWRLQLSKATTSLFSSKSVLPTAMGVTNHDGEFMGYLVLGLRANEINEFVEKVNKGTGYEYLVFDQNGGLILCSNLSNRESVSDQYLRTVKAGRLTRENPFLFEDISYTLSGNLKKYPLKVLVGKSLHDFDKNFHYQVLPRILEFIVVGLVSVIILYFFRKSIINPISKLSKAAFQLSKGNTDVKIPRQQSTEMNNLAKALLMVIRYIKRSENYKNRLEEANEAVRGSEKAKEDYIKKINLELYDPMDKVSENINFADKFLLESDDKYVPKEWVRKFIMTIKKPVEHIKSRTSQTLNLCEQDVNAILDKAIKINVVTAYSKRVTINSKFDSSLKKVWLDGFKVQQIFVSLIYQAVDNSIGGDEVWVTTKCFDVNGLQEVEVSVQDCGLGISEQERLAIDGSVSGFEHPPELTTYCLNLDIIKHVVSLHGGSCEVENIKNSGRRVIIRLPCEQSESRMESETVVEENVYNIFSAKNISK